MTVIGALSSFRELGEMSPHKRASILEPAAAGSIHDSSCDADIPVLICRRRLIWRLGTLVEIEQLLDSLYSRKAC